MLHLHIPTLLTAAAVVNVTLACFCLTSWFGRREREINKWLAISGFASTTGCILLLAWGRETPSICVWTAQGLYQLAGGTAWTGIRVFEGRKPRHMWLWAGPAMWMTTYFVPALAEDFTARGVASSSVIVIYYVAIAFELARGYKNEPLNSRATSIVVTAIHCLFLIGRIVFALTTNVANWQLSEGSNRIGVLVLEALMVMVVLVLSLTAMERDRVEIEQRKAVATDVLTGAMSRRAFLDEARNWVEARGRDAALIVFDLDYFKRINDTYGHAAGDVALVTFSQLVKDRLQSAAMIADFNTDLASAAGYPRWYETTVADKAAETGRLLFGRLGGEEFACLLPYLTRDQSLAIAEDIRLHLNDLDIAVGAATVRMSVSAAVVTTAQIGHHLDEMFAAADEALYRAKHAGRNRVECGQAVVNMAIRKSA